MSAAPTLDDIEAARARIRAHVRLTPILDPAPVRRALAPGARLVLKLECLQVTGSFKPRGAVAKLTSLREAPRGLVTASGGNHGIAVAYAAAIAGCPAWIYLPETAPPGKAQQVRDWGGEPRIVGRVWDESNAAAREAAAREGLTYFHPFADPMVIAGQGTLGLEILDQVPGCDTLLVAIGGGGLISGVALAAKARTPGIRIVGIEPVGAPTLYESVRAGALVTLPKIETVAGTLAPRRSEALNLEIIQRLVDDIVLVSDAEMREAARWLWRETGVAAEMSGAASLAALQAGKVPLRAGETVVAIVCGAGTDGIG